MLDLRRPRTIHRRAEAIHGYAIAEAKVGQSPDPAIRNTNGASGDAALSMAPGFDRKWCPWPVSNYLTATVRSRPLPLL